MLRAPSIVWLARKTPSSVLLPAIGRKSSLVRQDELVDILLQCLPSHLGNARHDKGEAQQEINKNA